MSQLASYGAAQGVRPCPFCGHDTISVHEGSTFRWRLAECNACGARSGEVRIQTLGDGTREEWETKAHRNALQDWNERADQPPADLNEKDACRYRQLVAQFGVTKLPIMLEELLGTYVADGKDGIDAAVDQLMLKPLTPS